MRSSRHKVLHLLGGKPLIERVLSMLEGAGVGRVVVVTVKVAELLPANTVTVAGTIAWALSDERSTTVSTSAGLLKVSVPVALPVA